MTDNLALSPDDVEPITKKVFPSKKPKKEDKGNFIKIIEKKPLKKLSLNELEILHSYYHSNMEFLNSYCRRHFIVANEMIDRGLKHVNRSICDKAVTLYRNLDINFNELEDSDLIDYTRIVLSWYTPIVGHSKSIKHLKKLTPEILESLRSKTDKEIKHRGIELKRYCKKKEHKMSLEEFYDIAPQHIIINSPPYVYYNDDNTSLIIDSNDSNIIKSIKTSQPNEWSSNIDTESECTNSVYTLYKYGLFKVPKSEFLKDTISLSIFDQFVPPEAIYYNKNELSKFSSFYYDWVVKHLSDGIIIHKNYNGIRAIIHKKDDNVKIESSVIFSNLNDIIKELKTIDHNFILDTTIIQYDCKNKDVKSACLKEMGCDESPIVGESSNGHIVFHINDILFLDDKSLNKESYSRRLEKLREIISDNLQYFSIAVQSPIVGNYNDVIEWTKKLNSSKGVLFKVSTSTYPIKYKKNKTSDWIISKLSDDIELTLSPCEFKTDSNICPIVGVLITSPVDRDSLSKVKCNLTNTRECYYKILSYSRSH